MSDLGVYSAPEIAEIPAQMDERNEAEDEEHGHDDGSGSLGGRANSRSEWNLVCAAASALTI